MGDDEIDNEDRLFCRRAMREARKRAGGLKPYEDSDTITFGPHCYGYVKISDDFETQVRYSEMRRNGESHAMAEMLATRSFPGTVGTDRAFMQGRLHQTGGQQFENLPRWVGEQYVQKALAAGVNPNGKYYSGSLARFPGDPRAWIDSLGDVRRVAAERGLSVQGAVNIEPPEPVQAPDPAPYRVAPDIVQVRVAERLAEQPELASKREEVTYEVSKTLAGVHGQ